MEKLGRIFVSNILNTIDRYEDKKMYDYFHFYAFDEMDYEKPNYNLKELKEHLSNKIYEYQNYTGVDVSSETLLVIHKENGSADFITFTGLADGTTQQATIVTYSPGTTFDIETSITPINISDVNILDYVKIWKDNVIQIKSDSYNNDKDLYDNIYSEISKQFSESYELDDIITSDEVSELKNELENLKNKVKENEEWSKQQIEEFNKIIEDLKNIKPLDTKKQWMSKLISSTSLFVKKHPMTSVCVLNNLTNGFTTINSIPPAFIADKAVQMGLPENDVKKALELNESAK